MPFISPGLSWHHFFGVDRGLTLPGLAPVTVPEVTNPLAPTECDSPVVYSFLVFALVFPFLS